jgi:hypothetical protein
MRHARSERPVSAVCVLQYSTVAVQHTCWNTWKSVVSKRWLTDWEQHASVRPPGAEMLCRLQQQRLLRVI